MRTITSLAIVAALVGGVALADNAAPAAPSKPAAASKAAPKMKMKSASGTVDSVDVAGKSLMVKGKKGETWKFMVADKALIKKAGKKVELAAVMAGDSVTVKYEAAADGSMTAHSIFAKAPKAPAKKS